MSLLEDIFLGDEAEEAQELERVIDGDEYDGRPRSSSPNSNENSEKEDEAEEDKRRVDPTQSKAKRVVKNPRFILNPARLTGPRGIQIIPDHFKDFKFKGKGHEKEDLDIVLKKLEHWAYRLYPKFQFEDCLKKIETLGKKRPVMVHLQKIRSDQFVDEPIVQRDSSDDEAPVIQEEDEFDKLLQQQIDLARATPAPASARKEVRSPVERSLTMPKATSSPSISDEQRDRMLKNRRLAEERRLAKLNQNNGNANINGVSESITSEAHNFESSQTVAEKDEVNVKNHNKSQIIYSSDEECEIQTINQSVSIEVHKEIQPISRKDSAELNTDEKDKLSEMDVEKISKKGSCNMELDSDVDAIEKDKHLGVEIGNEGGEDGKQTEEDYEDSENIEKHETSKNYGDGELSNLNTNKEHCENSLNTISNKADNVMDATGDKSNVDLTSSDSSNENVSKNIHTEVMDVDFSVNC